MDSAVEAGTHEFQSVTEALTQWASSLKLVEPILERLVTLAAVARATGRHNVSGCCSAAKRHSDEVIDRIRLSTAIDTGAAVYLEQVLITLGWNGIDIALSAVDVLLTPVAKFWVFCVAIPDQLVAVCSAPSTTDVGAPIGAVSTPGESFPVARQPNASAWTDPIGSFATCNAFRVSTIRSRDVTIELATNLPGAASVAPFLAEQDTLCILGGRKTEARRRGLHHAMSIAGHGRSLP
jgi:hypothetical protein